MIVIWIGLFPALLSLGDAVILSSLPLGWTRVVLAGHYQPLPVLFGTVLGDPGRPCVLGPLESPCPIQLGCPVEGLASFVGCDVLWGPSFPNYL